MDTETAVEREERLYWEVERAMELAKDAGFRPIPDMCVENRFVVGRNRPGVCYEVISFRALDAQAVRCDVTPVAPRLILLDESQVGTSRWTGTALEVVQQVLEIS